VRASGSGPGRVVVLNGAPRSGKSSIAAALQADPDGCWMALGVDVLTQHVTPPRLRPGLGLRPGGGERPDIEERLPALVAALYGSVAVHAREGFDVVVDVGHHDAYGRPLHLLRTAAQRLTGLPAWLIGVHCPLEVVVARRELAAGTGRYQSARAASGAVADAVVRWQEEVHRPGIYDLTVDTSVASPERCAETILDHLASGPPPRALASLARE
jgi:chloramphenicol 3-O phosphotransferase